MVKPSRLVLPGVLLLAAYWALFGGEYSVFEVRSANAEVERARAELEALRAENDSLRAWAARLETDSATLERIARENMGMIRPGEVLYRLVPDTDTVEAADTAAPEGTPRPQDRRAPDDASPERP